MYQDIFDTDFDKYTEDAVTLFSATGIDTVFENLDGFPKDWKTKPAHSSNSSAIIIARVFLNTVSILTSALTRSRRR